MMKLVHGAGSALLGLFVTQINADASTRATCTWYSHCWQCNYKSCAQVCQGGGCSVYCGRTCS